MLLFWIAAALLSAAAVSVVLARGSRASAAESDPEGDVYRRQLDEVDDLKARGLLDEDGWRAARAETGRRLLAVERRRRPEPASDGGRARAWATATAAGAVLLGAGLYMAVGSPGLPDQPFAARIAAWRAGDPADLTPEQAAAVLQTIAAERPGDPRVWSYLGRAWAEAGQPMLAVQAFEKALALQPSRADDWAAMGESLTQLDDGKVDDDARRAFDQALKLDPNSPAALFFLGRDDIARGRREVGLARWRALVAALPEADPRRVAVEAQIREVESGRAAQAAAVATAAPEDQAAMIRGMVDGLAARLEASPDDPEGWARLVRAYGVLGDTAARQHALQRARGLFRDRPEALAKVEAAAR
jgi:cytochrome c-type biogenesis protein CcmH